MREKPKNKGENDMEKYFVSHGNSYGPHSDYYTVPMKLTAAQDLADEIGGLVWFVNEAGEPETV